MVRISDTVYFLPDILDNSHQNEQLQLQVKSIKPIVLFQLVYHRKSRLYLHTIVIN